MSIGHLAPFSFPAWPTRWSTAPRRGRRLERHAESLVDRALQRGTVEDEAERALAPHAPRLIVEQCSGQPERIADPHAQPDMEFARQGEEEERGPGNAAGHAAARGGDAWHRMLGQQVVRPLGRRVDRK